MREDLNPSLLPKQVEGLGPWCPKTVCPPFKPKGLFWKSHFWNQHIKLHYLHYQLHQYIGFYLDSISSLVSDVSSLFTVFDPWPPLVVTPIQTLKIVPNSHLGISNRRCYLWIPLTWVHCEKEIRDFCIIHTLAQSYPDLELCSSPPGWKSINFRKNGPKKGNLFSKSMIFFEWKFTFKTFQKIWPFFLIDAKVEASNLTLI